MTVAVVVKLRNAGVDAALVDNWERMNMYVGTNQTLVRQMVEE